MKTRLVSRWILGVICCLLSIMTYGILQITAALPSDCSTLTGYNIPQSECDILVELYNATNGDSRTDNANRGTGDACDRNGINCVIYTGQAYVNRIDLSANNLSGTLPSKSLTGLTYLQYFYINDNNLYGQILPERSSREYISAITMENNNLTGSLPDSRSARGDTFTFFRASYNNFTGSLPDSRSTRTQVTTFNLNGAGISGELPESRSGRTHMYSFQMDNNFLTGTLPDSRATRTGINDFIVGDNYLQGYLPESRSVWESIEIFYVDENPGIVGPLPDSWSNRDALRVFGVGGRAAEYAQGFSGDLPDIRGTAWADTLEAFYIRYTDINSQVPSSRSARTGMTDFRINNNFFYGTTDFAADRPSLNIFNVSNNCYQQSLAGSGVTATSLTTTPQETCFDYFVNKSTTFSGSAFSGNTVAYTLSYGATGHTNTTGSFSIEDVIDSSLVFGGSDTMYTTGLNGSGDLVVTWSIANLPAGGIGSILLTGIVMPVFTGSGVISNTATLISTGSAIPDTGTNNTSETVMITVAASSSTGSMMTGSSSSSRSGRKTSIGSFFLYGSSHSKNNKAHDNQADKSREAGDQADNDSDTDNVEKQEEVEDDKLFILRAITHYLERSDFSTRSEKAARLQTVQSYLQLLLDIPSRNSRRTHYLQLILEVIGEIIEAL